MSQSEPTVSELIDRASKGDQQARGLLLSRHRDRLKRMVAIYLDARLAPRVDPSDVIQEAMVEAATKLDAYIERRPVPFYPWLRHIVWERLIKLHQFHIDAARRSVVREQDGKLSLPHRSTLLLVDRLMASDSNPAERMVREEERLQLKSALENLPARDREVLVMRHLEELSIEEIGAVLGIRGGAVKMRLLRAMERLRECYHDLDDRREQGA